MGSPQGKPPCGPPCKACQHLREWYAYGLGRALAEEEAAQLAAELPTLFGYHLLQLGSHIPTDYLANSPIRHKIVAGLEKSTDGSVALVSEFSRLPIASDSVDVVILPHTLEMDADPHQVLREVERVLVAEGYVIVLGFNPWSSWGLRRLLRLHRRQQVPWCGRFISPMRTKDWLSLLGFEIRRVKTFFHRPPISHRGVLRHLTFLDKLGPRLWPAFGAVSMYVAQKRVSTLTPIGPRWRRRQILSPGLIETRQ